VYADLVRLEQVLVNLIGNALQAMAETQAPRLVLRVETESGEVRISVADTGPGIPETHLSRIFEPFFTTKSPGSGLGLGLSISARIINDLGGSIEATNLAGAGARFTITLPQEKRPDGSQPSPTEEQRSHA
ncbi:MAG: GHKL domain-containing protein, partial [Halomonas sp.]|nr:GHKL domain-containing protein [Halomonas sp.]MDX5504352.1 GHKL domain-containing protein [Halomonas sp.]